ncbi:MAG: hypothetical protein RIQ97_2373 [Pseudomonadota bacterium]|jgi:hypothetical protein
MDWTDLTSSLQLDLLIAGLLLLMAVLAYNLWSSRRSRPRQPEPSRADPAAPAAAGDGDAARIEPTLDDPFAHLPTPERKPALDALIDVMATVDVDQWVSGEAALAALPSTRRIGTKPFLVEGRREDNGVWESVTPGQRYTAFQAGIQLANRMGPLNEIEYSEFAVKTQAFAEAVGGSASLGEMLQEVARGRELDQFASAHDAQLGFTLCARTIAWSPGYVQQNAARIGFVAGVVPGRMVLPSATPGMPPVLSLTFDTAAALSDDPDQAAIREVTISLDVPQVPREEAPFARLREAAAWLAEHMDGVITDGSGQVLGDAVMSQIELDLQQLYDALDQRELSAGSPQARRLFS